MLDQKLFNEKVESLIFELSSLTVSKKTDFEQQDKILKQIVNLEPDDQEGKERFVASNPCLKDPQFIRDFLCLSCSLIQIELRESGLDFVKRSNLTSFTIDFLLNQQDIWQAEHEGDRLSAFLTKEKVKNADVSTIFLFSLWLDVVKIYLFCEEKGKIDHITSKKYKIIFDRYQPKVFEVIQGFYQSGKSVKEFLINNPWEFSFSLVDIEMLHCLRLLNSNEIHEAQRHFKIVLHHLDLFKCNFKQIWKHCLWEDRDTLENYYCGLEKDFAILMKSLPKEDMACGSNTALKRLHGDVLSLQARTLIALSKIELFTGTYGKKVLDEDLAAILLCRSYCQAETDKLTRLVTYSPMKVTDIFEKLNKCFCFIDPLKEGKMPYILIDLSGLCHDWNNFIIACQTHHIIEDDELIKSMVAIFNDLQTALMQVADQLLAYSEKRKKHYDPFFAKLIESEQLDQSIAKDGYRRFPLFNKDIHYKRDMIHLALVKLQSARDAFYTHAQRINQIYFILKEIREIKKDLQAFAQIDDRLSKYLKKEKIDLDDVYMMFLTSVWEEATAGLKFNSNSSKGNDFIRLIEEIYPEMKQKLAQFEDVKEIEKLSILSQTVSNKLVNYYQSFVFVALNKCRFLEYQKLPNAVRNCFFEEVLPRLLAFEKKCPLLLKNHRLFLDNTLLTFQERIIKETESLKLKHDSRYKQFELWQNNRYVLPAPDSVPAKVVSSDSVLKKKKKKKKIQSSKDPQVQQISSSDSEAFLSQCYQTLVGLSQEVEATLIAIDLETIQDETQTVDDAITQFESHVDASKTCLQKALTQSLSFDLFCGEMCMALDQLKVLSVALAALKGKKQRCFPGMLKKVSLLMDDLNQLFQNQSSSFSAMGDTGTRASFFQIRNLLLAMKDDFEHTSRNIEIYFDHAERLNSLPKKIFESSMVDILLSKGIKIWDVSQESQDFINNFIFFGICILESLSKAPLSTEGVRMLKSIRGARFAIFILENILTNERFLQSKKCENDKLARLLKKEGWNWDLLSEVTILLTWLDLFNYYQFVCKQGVILEIIPCAALLAKYEPVIQNILDTKKREQFSQIIRENESAYRASLMTLAQKDTKNPQPHPAAAISLSDGVNQEKSEKKKKKKNKSKQGPTEASITLELKQEIAPTPVEDLDIKQELPECELKLDEVVNPLEELELGADKIELVVAQAEEPAEVKGDEAQAEKEAKRTQTQKLPGRMRLINDRKPLSVGRKQLVEAGRLREKEEIERHKVEQEEERKREKLQRKQLADAERQQVKAQRQSVEAERQRAQEAERERIAQQQREEAEKRQLFLNFLKPEGFTLLEEKIIIPEHVQQIMQIFRERGFKIWLSGGAVRDIVLNTIPNDYDLITNCPVANILKILLEHDNAWLKKRALEEKGLDVYSHAKFKMDITCLKTPPFEFVNARDFTMNTLLADEEGRVFDPGCAFDDVKRGRIIIINDRCLEEPDTLLRLVSLRSRFNKQIKSIYIDKLKSTLPNATFLAFGCYRTSLSKLLLRPESAKNLVFLCSQGLIGHLFTRDPDILAKYSPVHSHIFQFWTEKLSQADQSSNLCDIVAMMLIPTIDYHLLQGKLLIDAVELSVKNFQGYFADIESVRAFANNLMIITHQTYSRYLKFCRSIEVQQAPIQVDPMLQGGPIYAPQFSAAQAPGVHPQQPSVGERSHKAKAKPR